MCRTHSSIWISEQGARGSLTNDRQEGQRVLERTGEEQCTPVQVGTDHRCASHLRKGVELGVDGCCGAGEAAVSAGAWCARAASLSVRGESGPCA